MKYLHLPVYATSMLFLVFLTYSCANEEIFDAHQTPLHITTDDSYMHRSLQRGLSHSLQNKDFVNELSQAVFELPTGDTEVLLSDLLSKPDDYGYKSEQKSPRQIFLESLGSTMTEDELDEFISSHPSHVFALRGNVVEFLDGNVSIPAYFMTDDFQDDTKSIVASSSGKDTTIDLSNKLNIPIIVIQKSERYDINGVNLVDLQINGKAKSRSIFEKSNIFSCENTNILNSFTARELNGGILLEYDIATSSLGSDDLDITISRLDPGGDEFQIIAIREKNDPPVFYDTGLSSGINVEYIYRITVNINTIDNNGNSTTCTATTVDGNMTFLIAQGGAISSTSPVASFVGRNISDSEISYTWAPPNSSSVNQYRLSVLLNGQYQEVARINPSQNQFHQYTYSYPEEKRGELIQMQIQYRSAGNTWVGDFYDRTYGSFRSGDEPLKYYGIRLNQNAFNQYEPFESQLRGAPEIRLVAAQATSSQSTDLPALSEDMIFTVNCCLARYESSINSNRPNNNGVRALSACMQGSDFNKYVPVNLLNVTDGTPILETWDNNIVGSGVTIITTETDETTARVTSGNISSSITRNIGADFGIKVPIIGNVEIGVETQHVSSAEYTLEYPGDIIVNRTQIYYHEPLVKDVGSQVFGYSLREVPSGGPNRSGYSRVATTTPSENKACEALD